jgi:hypothetical protein
MLEAQMVTQLLERLTDPRTREDALKLALDATAMAADQNDTETAVYIVEQLAGALRATWQPRMHVRLRSVTEEHRRAG